MFANVSFGIFAFHPIGWCLMLAVIAAEAWALRAFLPLGQPPRNHFVVSLAANALSGFIGFAVSMGITGGWWLVIWVPWVTANEASSKQWPQLAGVMGMAFVASSVLESVVVWAMMTGTTAVRVALVVGGANLATSVFLIAVFWAMGGVPGL